MRLYLRGLSAAEHRDIGKCQPRQASRKDAGCEKQSMFQWSVRCGQDEAQKSDNDFAEAAEEEK